MVAVTGGPESETLIRRGARLAQRAAGAELLAVHVIATDGLHSADERRLGRAQELVASVGGTFHSVIGEDVSAAVVDFAAGTNATMIIVGVSRHGRVRRLFTGTTGDRIASLAGSIDVHLVTHDQVARRALRRPLLSPLSPSRQVAGWVGAVALPTLLTWVLHGFADTDQLPLAMLTLLASTVAVALIGGLLPALLGAVIGFLTLNYFFTPPVGTLTVSEPRNLLALGVFVAVAAAVATVVDRASRRAADALRARAEAATMSGLSRSVLTGQDTAEAIVERLRETFGQDAVSLLAQGPAGWTVLASSGTPCAATPDEGDTRVRVDDQHVLALCGEPLRASDQRVLEAFAVQTGLVLEYRRLRERDERAANLERAEATSTALLRAVSHDLRTPLATMRAAVDGLLSSEVSAEDRQELVRAVDGSAEQLERLIDDLLDLSRLQSGLIHPVLRTRSLDEVLPLALAGHEPDVVRLEVEEPAPLGHHRRRAARARGGQPGRQRRPARPRVAGPGARPRAAGHGRRDRGRPGPRHPAGRPGADVRAVPAARRHGLRRPGPRAGRRPGPHRGPRRHPVSRGHARRRADHGAVAAPRPDRHRFSGGGLVSQGYKVLVVDDEPALARALAINLRAHGWEVVTAADGRSALDAAATTHPDVIVLDLGLPDMDGTEVISGLRGWTSVPIVVLSARQHGEDKVEALDLGADDYVTKPFAMNELMARLRAAVRRAAAPEPTETEVVAGDLVIDLARKRVRREGAEVRLTPTEWAFLELLARNVGRLVPREQILREVWGPGYLHEHHYLRVYAAQLRRKLEDDPSRPRHLLTTSGLGYTLEP